MMESIQLREAVSGQEGDPSAGRSELLGPPPEDREGAVSGSRGLPLQRRYTRPGVHPFEEIEWERRRSVITDEKGRIIFEANDCEVPRSWSQLATDIVVSKYFRKAGVPQTGRETSVRQVIHRIVHTIRQAGEEMGYFRSEEEAEIFEAELTHLLVTQKGAFNSPVWFNCGLYHAYGIGGSGGNWAWDDASQTPVETPDSYSRPQCAACFIQSVEDDLMSIFTLVKNEARVFKFGSGTGTNFSKLRGRQEKLSGGGTSSGLMSFLEVFDRAAGATKSGGTTRRAAKMVIVDMDHPEIVDFIEWKVREEKKVAALVAAGYSADFNGEAYRTVSGQNSNNSVRVTDEFMQAALHGGKWKTFLRTTGEVCDEYPASELLDRICQAAWSCADPGIQYDTTINEWNTCANTGRIRASNPCSEFMFLDDSACNLASLNLMKFLGQDGTFDVEGFRHACRVFILAQEILVDLSSYPTPTIARNSHDYRPLGLGYANLGTLLMVLGIPYDSDQGRAIAAALTAIMCGHAYATSAEIAASMGPFPGYAQNASSMLRVIHKHRDAAYRLDPRHCPEYLLRAAQEDWDRALELGQRYGYRNAQTTVIAPTGTIGLLMDCDTTGVEPDFALVKFKKLAGGGNFKIVNQSVPLALQRLGYTQRQIEEILTYLIGTQTLVGAPHINRDTLRQKGLREEELDRVEAGLSSAFDLSLAFNVGTVGEAACQRLGIPPARYHAPDFNLLRELGFSASEIEEANKVICGRMTLEGAPHLREEHLAVFDCANRCGPHGQRFIAPLGHVRMMAAVQPFISGSISKTVNLPNEATVEEVRELYVEGWRMGLKCLSLYRDGCKLSQPLSTSARPKGKTPEAEAAAPKRRRLPDERASLTHKFSIAGHEGYITVGLYPDTQQPGEIFITMSKQGSTVAGLMDSFATAISLALQYGVPLEVLVNKFSHMRFEPAGWTNNPQIRMAKSIMDYIFRWLALKFLPDQEQPPAAEDLNGQYFAPFLDEEKVSRREAAVFLRQSDAPSCHECGALMVRNGTCYRCLNCGATSGCS